MPLLVALPLILVLVLVVAALPTVAAGGVVHHTVEVRLVPAEHRIEVIDLVDGLRPGAEAAFDIAGEIEIIARVGGRQVEIGRTGQRRVVAVPASGEPLALEYSIALPSAVRPDGPFLDGEHGFLPGWAGWLPAFGGGESFEVTVEAPLPLKALASGSLVEEAVADGMHRSRARLPAGSEPPSLFAGRFVVGEREVDGVRLRTFFTPGTAALAERYLDQAEGYLRRFEESIGDHAYDSFAVVAAPVPVGLGFPGLTYVSERILPLPFMQTRSLAHEILHGWWGNAVRVAYDLGNWAEGLTTYMADYGILDDPAAEAAMRLAWLRDYRALPESRDAALRSFVARSHDAGQIVGYNKAAMVVHMLRRRVGDDAFHTALRDFYRENPFERASWDDLRASVEAAAGEDLGWFFAQWLERPGAPRLHLEAAARAEKGARLVITQEQPAYRLDVPVRIETAAGSEDHIVSLDGPRTVVSLDTEAPAAAVAIDPDHHLFRRLAPGEAPPIIRDVTLAPDAAVVLAVPEDGRDAAEMLASRLLGEGVAEVPLDALRGPGLIITVGDGIGGAAPPTLGGRGTARVWTSDATGSPVLRIEADDAAALEALLRPLPHYRRESWLVFDGATAIDRGVWPGGDSPLRLTLDGP